MATTEDDGGNEHAVVRLAVHQRAAEQDEPVCVICGRYGEYVCDVTDLDVCSLECRDICRRDAATQSSKNLPVCGELQCAETFSRDTSTSQQSHEELRRSLGIRVTCSSSDDSTPISPLPLWSSFGELPPQLLVNVTESGFTQPTPVQMQTIPMVLHGNHVLVEAPTGTGKTAAFLIPLIATMIEQQSAAIALVLVPVRELAMQIEDDVKKLVRGIPTMKTALVVGGLPLPPQVHRLRQGVQFVVGTPGRILDVFVHHGDELEDVYDSIRFCVIDEVDMMFSAGFVPAVTQITSLLNAYQLICTSATVTPQAQHLMGTLLSRETATSFVRIHVGGCLSESIDNPDTTATLNTNVDHTVVWVEEKAKKGQLFEQILSHPGESMLVFVESRFGADMLADAIQKMCNVRASSFHAGMPQLERLTTLEEFVNEDVRILVSTTVLGRGIDLLTVDHVVVFDAPKTLADYVHLVGRAGRNAVRESSEPGSARAKSTLFVNSRDVNLFEGLTRTFRKTGVHLPRQVFESFQKATPARHTGVVSNSSVRDNHFERRTKRARYHKHK